MIPCAGFPARTSYPVNEETALREQYKEVVAKAIHDRRPVTRISRGPPAEQYIGIPMSLTASTQDPFYAVRDEVAAKIEYIKVRLVRFEDLLNNTNTVQNADFQELRKGLSKEVKSADAQLRDLRRTVEYVENNRESFVYIDDAELSERRAFLSDAKEALLGARSSLDGRSTRDKMANDERTEISKYRTSGTLGAQTEFEGDNTERILDQQARVRMNLARQDQDLEELGTHVERVGETATIINEELRNQNRMLTTLDDDLDDASQRMNFVMARLGKLLKTRDRCQIWTIVLLSVILAVLVLMLIYT